MNSKFKSIIYFSALIFIFSIPSKADQPYMHGGVKYFDYGVTTGDLQTINTSLVSLGFASSTSSTDNTGWGFEIGLGYNISDNYAIEGSYVDLGTLTIKTNLTGPTENISTDIDGHSFAGGIKAKFGSGTEHFFVRGGMHSWELNSKVTTSLGTSSDPLGSGTDPWGGVGFQWEMVNLSYDMYKLDSSEITSLTFGVNYKF